MIETSKKEEHKVQIRSLQKCDFPGLTDLFRIVFHAEMTESYWDWKYFQNPYGEHVMYVALEDTKVVGETGAIPVKVKCGDESFLASQTLDIVVHPNYQKGGTFLKLGKLTIDTAIKRNLLFMYGFSVPVTLKVSSKLFKFRPVCIVKRWVLVLNPTPYLAKKFHMPLLTGVAGFLGRLFIKIRLRKRYLRPGDKVTKIHRFDERFDRFLEERRRDYAIMIYRDSTYLNWRYTDHPMKQYTVFAHVSNGQIKGFIVLTTAVDEVRRGIIMEIIADPAERKVAEYLLSAAMDYFYKEKVDAVMLWLPEHIPLVKEIEKWGFVRRDTDHNLIVRVLNRPEKWDNYDDYLIDSKNWYFTMGDSDYH